MQLRPPSPAPTATVTTTVTTAPTEEVWRRRLNGCRQIRRLLDGAESAAADALLYPARGIASADDNERLDKSFRHLYQLAMGEVARLGGDEVCLDALAMQSRCAIQENILSFNYLFKNCPHFRNSFFNQAPSATDVVRELSLKKARDNKRPEQFKRHFLRQTALVQFKVGTDNDDRAARVVNTLTKKVEAEVALF